MKKPALSSFLSSLKSATGFLLISTVAGYVFSYVYQLFMGRILGPEIFGMLGALVAIFLITSLFGQSLMEAMATNIAAVNARKGRAAAVSIFIRIGIKITLVCLLPCLGLIIAAKPVADFFHLPSTGPVILLGFSMFSVLMLNLVLGLLQGLQKFRQLGVTGFLASQGLKLLLGILFVWFGWELMGAVGSLLASTAIAALLGLGLSIGILKQGYGHQSKTRIRLTPVLAPSLILAVFLAMPASVDVMLVTHYFGGYDAGIYNAVATIGKVVIFLPMAVSFVLLPRVTERHTLGQNSRDMLIKGLLLVLILSGAVTLVCLAFPEQIIRIFFGEAYFQAQPLIGWYAAAMLLFALNTLLVHYSMAVRNVKIMLLADIITIIEVIVIVLAHQSLLQVIWVLLGGNLLIFVSSFPYMVTRNAGTAGR